MKRAFSLLLAVSCLAPQVLQAQNMSHEEEVVRNAYAKLSFMCELVPVNKAAFDRNGNGTDGPKRSDQVALQTAIAEATPVFSLTDFRTGAIADIANDPWSQFITWPAPKSDVLDVQLVSMSYNYSGNLTAWTGAKAERRPSTAIPPGNPDYYNQITVADAIRMKLPEWIAPQPAPPGLTFTRYAAYTVDVALQGKSSGQHRAIFFFGRDANAKEVVAPNDMISGPGILYNIRDIPVYPGAFLSSDVRNVPVVAAWVRSHEMPTSSCGSAATDEVCCAHGRCGISEADLNRELSAPLPSPKTSGGAQ
jgi:hypothetical protein